VYSVEDRILIENL